MAGEWREGDLASLVSRMRLVGHVRIEADRNYVDHGIPFPRSQTSDGDQRHGRSRSSSTEYGVRAEARLAPGDIVLVNGGHVGRCALSFRSADPACVLLSTSVIVYRRSRQSRFAISLLRILTRMQRALHRQLRRLGAHVQQRFNVGHLRKISCCPPMHEQRAIAPSSARWTTRSS